MSFYAQHQGVRVTVAFDPETIHTEEEQREGWQWQAILDNFALSK